MSIVISINGVVPICFSSSAKASLLLSSNLSRSAFVCLSIGASCREGVLQLTVLLWA